MRRRFCARRVWLFVLLGATVPLFVSDRALAATFTFVTTQAGLVANDSVDWGQLGADDTFVANPSPVVSSLSNSFTVSKTQATPFTRFDQLGCCANAPPPIAPGDHLLSTNDPNSKPNSIVLAGSMYAAGTEVFADAQGAFVARVTAYDSIGNVLASFTASGSTNPGGYGTGLAPFLGIASDAPFARIGFSLDSAAGDPAYLDIDTISLRTTPAPEPASLTALGLGAAALLFVARRRAIARNG